MKLITLILLCGGAVYSLPTSTTTPFQQKSNTVLNGDFVEMNKIPGTNLYTGVFYKMGMKKFPSGWITYTDKSLPQNKGNFVQIDLNPKNLPFYSQEEKWFRDIQWMFEPTENKNGYFVMRNKAIPNGMVTSKIEKEGGYRHLIVTKDENIVGKLSQGGTMRSEAMIKPTQVDESSPYKYQLKLLNHPQGTITWTETKYGEYSKYIQVSENENHKKKYEKGQEWWDDTLFSLLPEAEGMSLSGFISHLELTENIKTILDKYGKHVKTKMVKMMTLTNPDSSVMLENITISLHQFDKTDGVMKINEKVPITMGAKFRLPSLRAGAAVGIPKLFMEPTKMEKFDKIKLITKKIDMVKEIELQPKSSMDIKIETSMLENVELPFRAMVVIEGNGDRMMKDHSGIKKGPMPPEMILEEMKKFGDAHENFKMIGNKVVMWVTGVLKGGFNIGCDIVA